MNTVRSNTNGCRRPTAKSAHRAHRDKKEGYGYDDFVMDLYNAINSKPNPRQAYNFLLALTREPCVCQIEQLIDEEEVLFGQLGDIPDVPHANEAGN